MANTIPALKRSFLSSQARVLNTPLEVPEDWRQETAASEDRELSDVAIEEVLRKVNNTIKQHNASVFPAQALLHVAQQIDALYWAAAGPGADDRDLPPDAIGVDADLREDAVISSLPSSFPLPPSSPSSSPHQRSSKRQRTSTLEAFDTSTRYSRLRSQIQELNAQRNQARQQLEEAKAMAELLRPLRDARRNIQPNLGGRDSELEKEIDRMKLLGARLVAGLRAKKGGGLGDPASDEQYGGADVEADVGKKLEALLDMDS